jgi:hypothetical protein
MLRQGLSLAQHPCSNHIREREIRRAGRYARLSDNGATPISGPPCYRGGSNGPFRGELGDALEGSIGAPGMIKWPGRIKPGNSLKWSRSIDPCHHHRR